MQTDCLNAVPSLNFVDSFTALSYNALFQTYPFDDGPLRANHSADSLTWYRDLYYRLSRCYHGPSHPRLILWKLRKNRRKD